MLLKQAPGTTTPVDEKLEEHVRQIGSEIISQVRREERRILKGDFWVSTVLQWAMRNEETKLRLFRLIDVLPSLSSREAVVRHLRDYLGNQPGPFGHLSRVGLRVAQIGGIGERLTASLVLQAVRQLARRFIIPGTTGEVREAVRQMRERGLVVSLDVLGETIVSEKEAEGYQTAYLELLKELAEEALDWKQSIKVDEAPWGNVPRVNLSVKLSALHPYLDPASPEKSARAVMDSLRPIVRRAKELGAHVHLDMEEQRLKDLTLRVFAELVEDDEFRSYRPLGIVQQAYLKSSHDDALKLVQIARRRGTSFTVRLVKGAYWDFETAHARLEGWPVSVYEQKAETDSSFERLTHLFLENNDAIDLAVGSHNVRSVAYAMALREAMALPQRSVEFQVLLGMAPSLAHVLVERGERVRVYAPFGDLIPGMAYLVRRLLENTSNESFLRRGFVEDEPVDHLLANPARHTTGTPNTLVANSSVHAVASTVNPVGNANAFANEPHLDFADSDARQRMQQALDEVRARLGQYYPLLINGEQVRTKGELVSVNPSMPSEVVGTTARAGPEEIDRAVAAALAAFPSWRDRPVEERVATLRRAANIMRQRRHILAAWIVLEAAKPWRDADADVTEAIDFIEYYCQQAPGLFEPLRLGNLTGEFNDYLRQGRGVYGVISPWNFPLAILTGMTSAALITGNTVVMKPAEQTPVIAALMAEIIHEVGMPPGVLNYVPGMGEDAGDRLVRHPDVHGIAFTGSLAVGTHIYATANQRVPGSRHLKRVIAEMGGKNAIIVDEDADLDEAVAGVLESAFRYAGQKCSACSRAIVLSSAYERFLERLVEAARTIPWGPAWEPETIVGPLIDRDAQERVLSYIDVGRQESRPALVREVPDELRQLGGYYVPPAIFRDVPPLARLAQEEVFGPVLAVIPARTFDEALEMATSVDYALTGGLFSRNPEHVRQARSRFTVGNLYINRGIAGAMVGRQPFGGRQLSGVGFQSGGPDYLLQFIEGRVITENTLRRGFASEEL